MSERKSIESYMVKYAMHIADELGVGYITDSALLRITALAKLYTEKIVEMKGYNHEKD